MSDYSLSSTVDASGGRWIIRDRRIEDAPHDWTEKSIVWQRPYAGWDEDTGEYFWPADMRAEYERLTGLPEFQPFDDPTDSQAVNVVEMIGDPDDSGFDQKCRFGYRVEAHAVYCHNDGWLYSPRKCRRANEPSDIPLWDEKPSFQEDCPGYKASPRFTAT
jgi:hypothetical protein